MQKLFLTIAVLFAVAILKAQTPQDAQKALEGKKLDKAKEIVDKLTADPNQKSAYACQTPRPTHLPVTQYCHIL